jgi:cytochrome P450
MSLHPAQPATFLNPTHSPSHVLYPFPAGSAFHKFWTRRAHRNSWLCRYLCILQVPSPIAIHAPHATRSQASTASREYTRRPSNSSMASLLQVGRTLWYVVRHQLRKQSHILSIGQINSFTIFGQPVVIINSLDVARDILDNRSAVYSDRPYLVMGAGLCGWDRTTVLTPYGPRLKEHRSLFARGITPKRSVEKYHPILEDAARSFAGGLASNPRNLIEQVHQ